MATRPRAEQGAVYTVLPLWRLSTGPFFLQTRPCGAEVGGVFYCLRAIYWDATRFSGGAHSDSGLDEIESSVSCQ